MISLHMQDCSSIRQHCRSFNSAGKLHKYFSQCRGHCAERREGRTSIYIVINKLDALNYIVARYPEMHFKEEHFQLVAHKVDYYYIASQMSVFVTIFYYRA